jgi:hypothetical protein
MTLPVVADKKTIPICMSTDIEFNAADSSDVPADSHRRLKETEGDRA